jgi:hypothetical protein
VCRANAIALVLIRHGHPVHEVIILPSVQPFKDEAQIAEFKDPVRTRAVNTFQLGYKNQSVYGVSGTSRCLFSDKYKIHTVWTERTILEC